MGSLLWREGGKRLVIQWFDARGNRKQETIRAKALDGTPLAKRTLERDARRRLAEHELEVDRQRAGLTPISTDVLHRPLSWLVDWWWSHRGKALKSPAVKPFLEKHLAPILDLPLAQVTPIRVETLLHTELEGVLAPKSRKHLRTYLHGIFALGRRTGGPWHGRANPIDDVKPLKVPKVPRAILKPHEMDGIGDRGQDLLLSTCPTPQPPSAYEAAPALRSPAQAPVSASSASTMGARDVAR